MTKAPAISEHEPLAKYTSWRIGGPARYFANATSPDELRAALHWARDYDLPVFILGGGTNILVSDQGFPGLVLRYRSQELRVTSAGATARAWVAAGAPMAGTARRLAGRGWAGLQWAEGLPGTIGGAVFGNAGCYDSAISAVLERAWLLRDDQVVEWPVERFAYGYRTSALKRMLTDVQADGNSHVRTAAPHLSIHGRGADDDAHSALVAPGSLLMEDHWSEVGPIIVAAEFALTRAEPPALAEQMRRIAASRRGKTPVGSSCGSVFKNPPGTTAGLLIEATGLKGTGMGGAVISDKHANYIVNRGGASSADVLRLIDLAREHVLREFAIELALEVHVV
jgi:UDP-N-acetylmuramate dehydrogenase